MKKMIKGFCIGAAALIMLGILLCVGGLAAGGAGVATGIMKDIFERHEIKKVPFVKVEKDVSIWKAYQTKVSADRIKNLKIDIGAAEVEIKESSSDDVITVSVNGREIDIRTDSDTLDIRKRSVELGIGEGEHILLELPKNFQFDRVEISAGAGSVDIASLHANLMELEIGAGKAELSGLTAERAKFDIGAGEIVVHDGHLRSCDTDIGMGHFEYEGVLYDGTESADCKVDCGMGSAEFRLKGNPKDYNYTVDCSAGTVEIDGEHYSGLEHKDHISHHAESTFDIDCSMGKVTITFEGGNTDEEIDKVL